MTTKEQTDIEPQKIATTAVAKPPPAGSALLQLLKSPAVEGRIKDVLGDHAQQFASSILSLVNSSQALKEANPQSVVASAMIAASLDLPINPNLGFAHLVPYAGFCQFQMGYKGFVQLAQRTGLYRSLNACPVFEGELVSYSKLSGELILDESKKKSDTVIGYAAYMRLVAGYERAEYWPMEKVKAHAAKFSQAYKKQKKDSPWFTNFDAMGLKTVIKSLISHWGPMSVKMQKAIDEDQAMHRTLDAPPEYIDNDQTPAPKPARIQAPEPAGEHESVGATTEAPGTAQTPADDIDMTPPPVQGPAAAQPGQGSPTQATREELIEQIEAEEYRRKAFAGGCEVCGIDRLKWREADDSKLQELATMLSKK